MALKQQALFFLQQFFLTLESKSLNYTTSRPSTLLLVGSKR